jgi:hypothetical protein
LRNGKGGRARNNMFMCGGSSGLHTNPNSLGGILEFAFRFDIMLCIYFFF